jgi:protein TonB
MPSDLFGSISHRTPSTRVSRRTIVVVSIAGHAAVFLAVLFFSLSTPGLLPTPRTALAFFDNQRRVQLVDMELPAPKRPAANPVTPVNHVNSDTAVERVLVPSAPINLAPIVAPTGIPPETGLEAVPSATRPPDLSRIEGRANAGGFDLGVGRVERPAALPVQTPVRLHSGIREPVKLANVDPVYPVLAQSARVQGVVILEAVVDASGRVESVHVLRSIALLDQAAVAAVRQWRYSPTLLNGSPVPVIMTITVNFKL